MSFRNILMLSGIVFLLASCQPNHVGALFSEVKKNDNYMGVTVPKWMIRTVDKKFITKHAGAEEAMKAIQSIQGLRAVVNMDKTKIDINKIKSIMSKLSNSKRYDEMLKFRADGNDIHVFVREKRERVKQIIFVTELKKEYAILELKTDINVKDLDLGKIVKNVEDEVAKD